MNPIKPKNRPLIWAFSVINATVFWYLYSSGSLDSFLLQELETILAKSGALGGASIIIALVLDSVLPRLAKEVLVNWRFRHAAPGHRAFSHYVHKDSRIDSSRLQANAGQFPTDPVGQNTLWYQLYRDCHNEPSVVSALKDYLLARDLGVISLLFMLGGTAMLLGNIGFHPSTGWFAVITAAEYVIFSHIARIHGAALVTNVLAIISAR